MATTREISVTLRANVADFQREMGKASGSLDQLVKKSGDQAGASQTAMGQLVQSANLQRESWSAVGGTLVGVGTSILGVATAVAATGIAYNSLQQSSRAALTTILGGAQQANAQMDKLDAFARTSPFAKTTFITAQQQMLAFGIESKKVIPYLSAINEATAAAGGSSQQLGELAFIMAQISAAGKITAQDLMQFGQRGVNAAELIGSQMGKTGKQIREEISKGTLGADEALDALAAGMQTRFEGASAGVKNTMSGAFDRVSAAWRDLSADLMSTAVGPEGGGWFVGLTNSLADVLRNIQALPTPVLQVGGGLAALSGATMVAAGSIMVLMPKMLDLWRSAEALAVTMPRLAAAAKASALAFGAIGIALVAATVVYSAWATKQAEAKAVTDRLTASMEGQVDALSASTRAVIVDELQKRGAYTAAERLGIAIGTVTDAAMGNEQAIRQVAAATDPLIAKSHELGSQMSQTNGTMAAFALTQDANAEASFNLRDALGLMQGSVETATDAHRQKTAGMESDTTATQGNTAATQENTQSLWDAASAALALSGSNLGVERAVMTVTARIRENNKVLNDAKKSVEDKSSAELSNREALDQLAASMVRQREQQEKNKVSTDVISASVAKNREEFLRQAASIGITGAAAEALADEYELIPGNVHTDITASANVAGAEVENFGASLDALPEDVKTTLSTPGAQLSQEQVDLLNRTIGEVPGLTNARVLAPGARPSKDEVDAFVRSVGSVPGLTEANIRTMADLYGVQVAQTAIDRIKDKTVTIRTRYATSGVQVAVADGGMFTTHAGRMVQAYASGGIHSIGAQQSQIRPAGGKGILWAEEGAGPWESFISGHPAKRARSRMIAGQTVRMLGGHVEWDRYADGGIRYTASPHTPPAFSQPSAAAPAGISPAALAQAVRDGLDGAQLRLGSVDPITHHVTAEVVSAARRL